MAQKMEKLEKRHDGTEQQNIFLLRLELLMGRKEAGAYLQQSMGAGRGVHPGQVTSPSLDNTAHTHSRLRAFWTVGRSRSTQ
ncbi:hypothetical protein ILYODFUR_002983 [Ilyodon furcidens]|uniref:Uncharacterized protein n=1 Tax=Ilyodon furcidens TaxID=33524 RepID=A0ABV0V0N9_9TELE